MNVFYLEQDLEKVAVYFQETIQGWSSHCQQKTLIIIHQHDQFTIHITEMCLDNSPKIASHQYNRV